MESKVTFLGHPIHQILIAFPLGLLGMSLVFDLVAVIFDEAQFARAAYYMIGAGVISGLVAAPFGLVDWLAIPDQTRAKRVGLFHAAAMVAALLFFSLAWIVRRDAPHDPDAIVLILEVAGAGAAVAGGWFGGELIDRLGVGVSPGAHLDAPSSLSNRSVADGIPSAND